MSRTILIIEDSQVDRTRLEKVGLSLVSAL
jgi:hypothetical protein